MNKAAKAKPAVAIKGFRISYTSQSFSFLLMLHLLDLLSLLLDLLLLLLQLALGLLLLNLLVLHLVADEPTAQGPDATANCSSRSRCADGRADYRAGAGTDHRADTYAFFTRGERLPGASGHRHRHY
jgi:hypothetical protein